MTVHVSNIEELVSNFNKDTEFNTQEYFINMGPQHPATHGVLRLILKLDGERVRQISPVLGYIHRSIEKMCEHMPYRNIVHLTDRMDYLSSMMNNWAVSKAVEDAMEIETNDRIEYIRTIIAELERIQSHQLWWGVLGMDLGAFTPFLYCFRDREKITDIFEETAGARLTMNYILPGGLMFDIHPNFVKDVKDFLVYFKPKLEEYHELVSGNIIIQERLRDVGIINAETAIDMSLTGPALRASGVPYDLRKISPYGVYDKVEFDIPVGSVGDCWDRYSVRLEEINQSMKIIEQLIDNIPEGNFNVIKPNKKLKPKEGKYYSEMETARGILGTTIISKGKEEPYRLHFRTPNFHNMWSLKNMAENGMIGELVASMATLDLVIPDIDR